MKTVSTVLNQRLAEGLSTLKAHLATRVSSLAVIIGIKSRLRFITEVGVTDGHCSWLFSNRIHTNFGSTSKLIRFNSIKNIGYFVIDYCQSPKYNIQPIS